MRDARRIHQQDLGHRRRRGNRGFLLIASYLLLSVFLVYSNAMVLHNMRQGLAMEQFRARVQALDMAQGALEQMREDLYHYLSLDVPQLIVPGTGEVVPVLEWLDSLKAGNEYPPFDPDKDGVPDGRFTHPLSVSLPTLTDPAYARAWVTDVQAVDPADPLSARLVTVQAEARVGAITKRIQAVYELEPGMSDIFRYAYFINNYGWFNVLSGAAIINGDLRSNGDLNFSGNFYVHGDLYAAKNPLVDNPNTLQPSTGTITGDPSQFDLSYYLQWKFNTSRPTRKLTLDGQPPIGGVLKVLPQGSGWDYEYRNADGVLDQRKYVGQPVQPMPYLGDLDYYNSLAVKRGGTVSYWDGTAYVPIEAVYKGPDGQAGTADDQTPLVLFGSPNNPIQINGAVVVPGDVLIAGYVTGRGTIYTGRNMHILAGIHYINPPQWKQIERDMATGEIRAKWGHESLGAVCNSGAYVAPGQPAPGGCMP
ncbi:MAG: hypothetical protein HYZ92_01375 [Candidatus Omnitrophica bacterium]|nr:hypothetical protein [Candidatus Omnitrophota bacterium]